VYLHLHVKVREDWRQNDRTLDDLGLPKRRR
jgi:GTPase Era involved in 16S rRNA processing